MYKKRNVIIIIGPPGLTRYREVVLIIDAVVNIGQREDQCPTKQVSFINCFIFFFQESIMSLHSHTNVQWAADITREIILQHKRYAPLKCDT
jgi:hypothetical protein